MRTIDHSLNLEEKNTAASPKTTVVSSRGTFLLWLVRRAETVIGIRSENEIFHFP